MKLEQVAFESREERSAFVVRRFARLFQTPEPPRVLDVGCDRRMLLKHLGERVDYVGIDIGGEPDIRVNLDETPALPFESDRFDVIVCTDVLEHLDKMHAVFEEMVRVARPGGHLVISLPNCWRALRNRWRRGHGTPRFYGLPPEPPEDRHRWFFNTDDTRAFFEARQQRDPIEVVEQFAAESPRAAVDRSFRRLVNVTPRRYRNRYATSVWTVLRKRPSGGGSENGAVSGGGGGGEGGGGSSQRP